MIDPIQENTPIFSISTTAEYLGIHVRTLMLYEYEKLVIPKRNPANRRMYSQNDLRKLFFIQYLTRQKKINFAGIRIILSMIEKGNDAGIDFKKEIFPDFKE